MTSLYIVIAFTCLTAGILAGWRRSAKQATKFEERWHEEVELVAQLRVDIEVLSAAPPDIDEQRRMFDRVRAARLARMS